MPEYAVPLFPEAASENATQVDRLFLFLVGMSAFFTVLIFILIVSFAIRYRRGSKARRGGTTSHLGLEFLWSAIPLAVVMTSFFWGARLFIDVFKPPKEAIDIYVVGKQWMWRVYHGEGRREINQLHVPAGQAVRLQMVSEDVIHSFYIPAFRRKQDVLPGRYTGLWFRPNKVGRYHLFCAEYCGTSHSRMRGEVVVMEPDDYAAWVQDPDVEPAHVAGQRLFERLRCDSCHKAQSIPAGPSLHGLFGSNVALTNGRQVVADLAYLRESILDPAAQVVAGYEPTMPTYQGQVSEEDILQLIAYMRTQDAPGRNETEAP